MHRFATVLLLLALCVAFSFLAVRRNLPTEASAADPPKPPPTPTPGVPGFSFEELRKRARALAAENYKAPEGNLPESLLQLNYDQYRDIRFRPDQALWHWEDLGFEVQFFHPGSLYRDPARVHVIHPNRLEDVEFKPETFDYGSNQFPEPIPQGLGFAGFRLHYPVNRPDYRDEVAVFQGASYFRILGAGQLYGLSARGLAIDTALPTGEEFPRFSEFWLEKPPRGAKEMAIYALLESESMTGAYRFVVTPGKSTSARVEAYLYPRNRIPKLGVAPLNSMFLYGESRLRWFPDFRPEVHDSDGLLIANRTGEWLWRPLTNPERWHRVSRFQTNDPVGFALLQRDRDFASYEDLESRYERRPSYFVETHGNWGKGAIELVEIPSEAENNDNVVAYWVPERPVEAGGELHFSYTLHSFLDDLQWPPLARAQATRIDPGYQGRAGRLVLDFHGPWLPDLEENAPVVAEVGSSRGKIVNLVTQRNQMTGGWRTFFDVDAEEGDPIELRVFLRLGTRVLTETWTYRWEVP